MKSNRLSEITEFDLVISKFVHPRITLSASFFRLFVHFPCTYFIMDTTQSQLPSGFQVYSVDITY